MNSRVCTICGSNTIVKGISLVCLGCGNATRTNLIFSREQEFQVNNLIRRTTQYIKQKKERNIISHQNIQDHLKYHWVEYLTGFSKFLIHLGNQLHLDIKPLYRHYLEKFVNQPLISNWTVARKGHQELSKDRMIYSKYRQSQLNFSLDEPLIKIEEESQDHDIDFEKELQQKFTIEQLNDNSIMEIQQIKKRIAKPKRPFYLKRQIKKMLIAGQKDTSVQNKRKISAQRKGSLNIDYTLINQDRKEFIQSILEKINLNIANYLALIELYNETFYSNQTNEINKIKNIKQGFKQQQQNIYSIEQDQFNQMAPFMQMEFLFLSDILSITLQKQLSFNQMLEQWNQFESNIPQKNFRFLKRKFDNIKEYLQKRSSFSNQLTQSTDVSIDIKNKLFKNNTRDFLPLDFTIGLVILYGTSLIINGTLFPSKLIQIIKQKKNGYLDGFAKFLHPELNQYLAYPQNIPSPQFIRENTLKLLKKLQITYPHTSDTQFKEIFKIICQDLQVSQKLFDITMSLQHQKLQNYAIDNSQYDIFSCAIIIIGFKIFLEKNSQEAIETLSQIVNYQNQIQPYDYQDLKSSSINTVKQQLEELPLMDNYYNDKNLNQKINKKMQEIETFFEQQQFQFQQPEQICEIKNTIIFDLYQQEYEYIMMENFDDELPQVRQLENTLRLYLEEDSKIIINLFQAIEKHIFL